MNPQSQKLATLLANTCPSVTKRPEYLAVATATVLSRLLDLPDQRIDSLEAFLNAQCSPMIKRALSEVNSCAVLDLNLATRLTIAFWKIRYECAYPKSFGAMFDTYGFVDTYVGAGNVLSKEDHCLIQPYQANVRAIAPAIEAMIVGL